MQTGLGRDSLDGQTRPVAFPLENTAKPVQTWCGLYLRKANQRLEHL